MVEISMHDTHAAPPDSAPADEPESKSGRRTARGGLRGGFRSGLRSGACRPSACRSGVRTALIATVAALLFLLLVLQVYRAAGSDAAYTHCSYDSYTKQALAWRRGSVRLDRNYPHLELAIINREYLAQHGRHDYMAYREQFGGINAPITDQPGNEYYVSFPPFPSVPMLLLSFPFGENTPNTMVCILYTVAAFLFALLTVRRFRYAWPICIGGAAFLCIASSAFFLCTNYIAGGVWFQAQTLALALTMGAFYFALRYADGGRDRNAYAACILLACAVGCRPFQLLYFVPLTYLFVKRAAFRRREVLRLWKFYVPPALIGIAYMAYNYVRFGNVLEFGHNYLPEFMREPAGQFGWEYVSANLRVALSELPAWQDGALTFSRFGFAFWVANVLVLLVPLALLWRCVARRLASTAGSGSGSADRHEGPEILLLFGCVLLHFLLLLLHKTLGGWQFGFRYGVDMLPGILVLVCYAARPFLGRTACAYKGRDALFGSFCGVAGLLLLFGCWLQIYGAYHMFP